ncbi:hypothetical protein ACFSQ7_33795 [Paenibacillus rhizoplanae]
MVGFFVMSVLWTSIALIGNSIHPTSVMEGKTFIDVLTNVFQTGPENYGKAILVNIFFGAFFGRVLIDTGIAATLIRKVVELGGDKPRITMSLLCIVTAVIFTSMTGIGPVISIAVIVLPIMLSLGIPSPIALFSFMGSIMAGIFGNIVNFKQYQAIFATANESYASYDYNTYFKFGMIAMAVSLIVVLVVSNVMMNRKLSRAWAATPDSGATVDAPAISWISIILPVVGVVVLKVPIIFGFIFAALFALLTCGKLKGGFASVCRMLSKQFADGAIDVAPMIGFLLTLSMFNNAATYASPYFKNPAGWCDAPDCAALVYRIRHPHTAGLLPRPDEPGRFGFGHPGCRGGNRSLAGTIPLSAVRHNYCCTAASGRYTVLGCLGLRLYEGSGQGIHEDVDCYGLDHRYHSMCGRILHVRQSGLVHY